jgi:hypothetical protein
MRDLLRRVGGIYYTRVVHRLNNEFTEDKHVVLYGWLSLQISNDAKGVNHTRRCQSVNWLTTSLCVLPKPVNDRPTEFN